jgi:hypothetical protein
MNGKSTTSFLMKTLTLAGVAAFCYSVLWISPITVISRIFALEQSPFFLLFEQHFWQYSIAFIAVVVLSRGHLWSYGINSQNLKVSMVWLTWLYGFTMLATAAAAVMGRELVPAEAAGVTVGTSGSIIASLVYWMSSPVANQILFFSFAQSVLMKQWGDSFRVSGIPLPVIIVALFFAAGATSSRFEGEMMFIPTLVLGLFCGTVYWKTNSLITPMLGHAFFFGFPFFIHLLRSGGVR